MSADESHGLPWWRTGPAAAVGMVLLVMVFVAGLYAGKFWWGVQNSALASSPEALGQFGDYFGGLLNPVVALAALGLLAWSIGLQKRELSDTRKALEQQARSSETLVQINALSAMITTLNSQIAYHQQAIYEARRGQDGAMATFFAGGLGKHQKEVELLTNSRVYYARDLQVLLASVRPSRDSV